jgi:hypothetical protein
MTPNDLRRMVAWLKLFAAGKEGFSTPKILEAAAMLTAYLAQADTIAGLMAERDMLQEMCTDLHNCAVNAEADRAKATAALRTARQFLWDCDAETADIIGVIDAALRSTP